MAADYPEWPLIDVYPGEGAEVYVEFSTVVSSSLSGYEQRRAKWATPRHRFKIKFDKRVNSPSDVEALYNFYVSMKGSYSAFAYFDYDGVIGWDRVVFGPADGVEDTFWLPCHKDTANSDIDIYVNDSPKTEGAGNDYVLVSDAADSNQRKQIVFNTPPAEGALLETTFTGRRFFVVRFATDQLSYSVFAAYLYSIGVDLFEVKGE